MGDIKQKINGICADCIKHYKKQKYKRKHSLCKKLQIDPQDLVAVISSSRDKEFILKCLKSKSLNLTKQQKREIIASFANSEFIEECLSESEIGLSELDIANILIETKDVKLMKRYLEDKSRRLSNDEKIDLLLTIADAKYIKRYIEKNDLGLGKIERTLISKGESFEDIKVFLKVEISDACMNPDPDERVKTTIYKNDNIEYMAREESVLRGKEHPQIDTISQLSVEDVLCNPEMKKISVGDYTYTRREYLQLRSAADEILEGIEAPGLDSASQLEVFKEIYVRMARKMSYDQESLENPNSGMGAWNLYSGLVKDKCVCAGYATVLKNVLACVGIDCIKVGGLRANGKGGHAWNQVNIGGAWYNVDLTNDRDSIIEEESYLDIRDYLHADNDFKNNSIYSLDQDPRNECNENPYEHLEDIREGKYSLGRVVKRLSKGMKLQLGYLQDVFGKLKEDMENSFGDISSNQLRPSFAGVTMKEKNKRNINSKGDEYSRE